MPKTAPNPTLTRLVLKQRWLDLKIKRSRFSIEPELINEKRIVDDLIAYRTQELSQETV